MKPSKKRRIIDSDEEEDAENTDVNKIKPVETTKSLKRFSVDVEPREKSETPKAKVAKKAPVKEKLADDEDDEPGVAEKDAASLMLVDNSNKVWLHQTIDFLKPGKIRDKNRNLEKHPDFDPRTLHVPPEFYKDLSPGMAQWWKLKSDHFDCILFFKVGKFYELYHHDAIVGVKELGFTFMGKDAHAHSGFPEQAYEKMATALVEKGYKVARVEQTENPGK